MEMATEITKNLLFVINIEQTLDNLKKELSFQNPNCRIDIITKKPEEVLPGFEQIMKELEKSPIPLETKEINLVFIAALQPYCLKCRVEIAD